MAAYYISMAFPFTMSVAGILDVLSLTIPNRISLALLIGFFVAAFLGDFSALLFLSHCSAGLAILVVGFAMFACGWLGGGDAKLMAVAALWLGFNHLLPFLFWTAALGGLLALVLLTYRRFLPPIWLLGQTWALRLHDPKEGIPYGVAIGGAGLIVYPQTIWMTGIAG